jgi:hypothetical protein
MLSTNVKSLKINKTFTSSLTVEHNELVLVLDTFIQACLSFLSKVEAYLSGPPYEAHSMGKP